jgi:hypothetical protein
MVFKITIPETWNPGCDKTINTWFDKIYSEVEKQKGIIKN